MQVTKEIGLPDTVYRAAEGISASDAKHILPPRTPAHYAAHMAGEAKKEPSRAMLLGTMAHVAVLEPHRLDVAFVEKPAGLDFRTKEGKAWKESVGATPVLDAEEAASVRGIRESIARNKAARELLEGAQSEVSLFGMHRTGLGIKGRVDAIKDGVIVDVKTTSSGADAAGFSRQSLALNYHVSAAWYTQLARPTFTKDAEFYWIAVEVTPPFAVAVYRIHPKALQLGMDAMNDALQLIAECEDSGEWPSYADEAQWLDLPAWAYKGAEVTR